ncbi:MAG: putative integral rane protein [Thermoleophilia bacterium]|nr:putative integral rane protein [Thermoleophilia bacterium]
MTPAGQDDDSTETVDAAVQPAPEGMQDFAAAAGPDAVPAPVNVPSGDGLLARLNHLDHSVTERILVKAPLDGRPKRWVVVLRRFSEAGSYGIGWIVLFGIVGVFSSGWERGLAAGVAVVAMLGFNTLIKKLIRRQRPLQQAIDHVPGSYSMPSAHTSMAMVGAASMHVLLPEATIAAWVVAAALAWSRVMLGMHFLGDVLVGAALGIAVGVGVVTPLLELI